jgi:hypothetical protein
MSFFHRTYVFFCIVFEKVAKRNIDTPDAYALVTAGVLYGLSCFVLFRIVLKYLHLEFVYLPVIALTIVSIGTSVLQFYYYVLKNKHGFYYRKFRKTTILMFPIISIWICAVFYYIIYKYHTPA